MNIVFKFCLLYCLINISKRKYLEISIHNLKFSGDIKKPGLFTLLVQSFPEYNVMPTAKVTIKLIFSFPFFHVGLHITAGIE